MLANARVLGHTFDPLSVFWAIAPDGSLTCIVAEVHNTYGGRHAYLLQTDEKGRSQVDKAFYVSPFFTVDGRYDLQFQLTPDVVSSTVVLKQDGEAVFSATFRGEPQARDAGPARATSDFDAAHDPSNEPADPNAWCVALAARPAGRPPPDAPDPGGQAMSEAVQARWPGVAHTPRTPLKARVAKMIIKPAAQRVPVRLTFPDGTVWGAGGAHAPEMAIKRPQAFFARLGQDTKIGFGEAYMAGDWTTGPGTDLAHLLTPFADRLANLVPKPLQKLRGLVDDRLPHHERNSIEGSRVQHRAPLRPLQRPLRRVPRPVDDVLVGVVRSPTPSRSKPPRNARWTASSTRPASRAGTRMLEIGSGWGAARRPRRAARCPRHDDHDLPGAGSARAREVRGGRS